MKEESISFKWFFKNKIEKLNSDLEKEKMSIKHAFEIERLNLNKQNDKRIDEMHKQCEQQIFDNNKKCKSKIETLNSVNTTCFDKFSYFNY
jgi:hypothetical protein